MWPHHLFMATLKRGSCASHFEPFSRVMKRLCENNLQNYSENIIFANVKGYIKALLRKKCQKTTN